MSATRGIDLEDAEGLLAADRDGLLRAVSSAGSQVRAIDAAVEEGALDPLRVDHPPRSVIWVAGPGTAETAGAMLAATLGGRLSAPIAVVGEVPLHRLWHAVPAYPTLSEVWLRWLEAYGRESAFA